MKTPEEVNQLLLDEKRKKVEVIKTYIENSINSGDIKIDLTKYNGEYINIAVKELSEQLSSSGWFYKLEHIREYSSNGEVGWWENTIYLFLSSTPFIQETKTEIKKENGLVPLIMLFTTFVGYLYLYYQAMRPIH